jgi:two-component system sensor histidine kinase and response regulator WspE
MSTDGGLEDLPLIDLFRAEVETHTEVLNNALLALERSPADTSRGSEMMRAAHSIKGAARVVGVDPAVSVAHHMEDCFVAAQKGTLTLTPPDVDVLLRGVDLLGKISEATRDPKLDLASEFQSAVTALVAELEAMLTRGGKAGGPTTASGSSIDPTAAARPAPQAETGPIAAGSAGLPLPGAVTLTFPEVLDGTVAEELRRQLLAAGDQGCATVWFDLRATRDLDVQGLAFLAAVPLHVAKHGRPLIRLTGVSPEMETVLKVTGLSESYASPGGSPEDQ